MLSEERHSAILELLENKKAVTVTELTQILSTSESTIRRDLNTLDHMGKLNKVHGGATAIDKTFDVSEEDVATKEQHCIEEKKAIGKYAASLINDNDFVYIDAGTTTGCMIDYIENSKATFVTNGIAHAKKLLSKGLKTFVVGGRLKQSTEAIVGAEGVSNMKKYNFTKSFLGTNGIEPSVGCTTPDVEEAVMKMEAKNRSMITFVLADHTKFDKVFAISVCEVQDACIITDKLKNKIFSELTVIKEVL